jgi:ubiquinone/menaquinone biosynthesis C-methylase UbiE
MSSGTVAAMRDYYEQLWERLPEPLAAPDLPIRRAFLLAHVHPGEQLLDLGCGDGTFSAIAAGAAVDVVGTDVAEAALERARRAHPELRFERTEVDGPLPFEDNMFDVVFATEVIEHVADTARWLSEARRVLAPRGRILITTPDHGRVRLALGGIERYSDPLGDHLHLYTRRSLNETLAGFGFEELQVRTVGGPPLMRRLLLATGVR